jgi:two-component system, chemotaxis family, protein-glutamate methylesterase/glutaminase
MQRIRVLIVDDSAVIRRLLTDALSAEPLIEVVGTAPNGKIGLAKIAQLKPDLVTLDIEMPEMNGLEAVTEIRKLYPKLPIIMFSTLTAQGAHATLDALARGANDYVTKPANVGSVNAALQSVQNELIPRVKAFCRRIVPGSTSASNPAAGSSNIVVPAVPQATKSPPLKNSRIDLLVIGTSTGGPNALATVIPRLPGDLPVPVLVVQHMPPVFTKHLADRLNNASALSVGEAKADDLIQPGQVWIAPGDYHMTVRRSGATLRVALNQEAPENSCRPAVDVLFRSAASLFGPNLLTVVMTGMGQDGQKGCEVIRQAGGRIIAQDEATSVVWGMPGAVVRAGLAHHVVPLSQIVHEIMTHVRFGRSPRPLEMAGV